MPSVAPRLAVLTAIGLWTLPACRCAETSTQRSFGELGVVSRVDDQVTRTDREAAYDFGPVFMGQKVTQKLIVKNLGAGALTLSELVRLEGDPVRVGEQEVPGAVWEVEFVPGQLLEASELIELEASFLPPQQEAKEVAHQVTLELRVQNAPEGEGIATITLTGRGVSGVCELPALIDFGNVAVDDTARTGFEVRNPTALAATLFVGAPYSTSGDDAAFAFSAESARGQVQLAPGSARQVEVEFRPTEQKQYVALMRARASAQCQEQSITVTGRGVAQVLTWSPPVVDCGYVPPGTRVSRAVTFSNASPAPVALSELRALDGLEFGIASDQADPTRLTVPGAGKDSTGAWLPGVAELAVWCEPAALGPRTTQLAFSTGLARQPQGAVSLEVFGGGPDIQVTPSPHLAFGKVAYFAGAPTVQKRKLTVMNVGTGPQDPDPAANLRLGSKDSQGGLGPPYVQVIPLDEQTAPDEFTVSLPPGYNPQVGLEARAGKNTAELVVTLSPKSVGRKQAQIVIHSNDPDQPAVTLTATADAVVLPPCNYTVTPTTLSFGLISPPDFRDLRFTLRNNGTAQGDLCLVSGLDLAPGSSPSFSLPGGAIESAELGPGESLQVLVRVWAQGATPTGVTPLGGSVQFFLSSDTRPQGSVALEAQLAPSCLTIAPDDLDFGTVQVGCASATRTFSIYNTCPSPVALDGFAIQDGAGQPAGGPDCPGAAACPEFHKAYAPPVPAGGIILPPGGAPVTFTALYRPIDFGPDVGAMAIRATQNGVAVKYLVSLRGQGDGHGIQRDVFIQEEKPRADLLLVIDNSCSMADEQQSLATNFASFIKYAQSAKVDYRIAVTTTDMEAGGAQGTFVTGLGHPEPVLSPATPNVEDKFRAKVNLGISGSGYEQAAAPALAALTAPLVNGTNAGFLRDGAALAVVAITDEPDQSPQTTAYYLNAFWNIKGFNKKTSFTFNAIAGFSAGCRAALNSGDTGELAFYVAETNGVKDDICTPDWARTLEELGKTAFGYRTTFFLTAVPELTRGPIAVAINQTVVPAVDARGERAWQYDPVANSVRFEQMYVPEPGQTLTFTYFVACHP